MKMSKQKAISILEQYRDHCQTTVNSGDNSDVDNLKDANEALNWINNIGKEIECTACSGSGYYCGMNCGACEGKGFEVME